MHWIALILYSATALLCVSAARAALLDQTFWALVAAMLFVMAFVRAFGIDVALTGLVRELSQIEGWYSYRQAIQKPLSEFASIAMVTLATAFALIWRGSAQRALACLGSVALLVLLLLRSISWHEVDHLFAVSVAGFTVGSACELASLGIVAVAALLALRARGP